MSMIPSSAHLFVENMVHGNQILTVLTSARGGVGVGVGVGWGGVGGCKQ